MFDGLGSTHSISDIYPGMGATSTQERTNPKGQAGTAMGEFLGGTGSALSGAIGLPLPVLLTLGVLAIFLIRFYD